MSPVEAVNLIQHWGGAPVLAHPTYIAADLEPLLDELKEAGLVGMEVYYAEYTAEKISELAAIASRYDLVPCGGSDYHAIGNTGEPVPGSMGPPLEVVEVLRSKAAWVSYI